MIDLSSYNMGELRALQDQIKQEMKTHEAAALDKAREQIRAIAESVGVPLADLMANGKKSGVKKEKGEGTKAPTKYRHPEDASKVWSGRGRQPGWVREWVESGKGLEEIKVA